MTAQAAALLTPAEMALADRAAITAGARGFDLMAAAGGAVAAAISARWSARPVAVLCGPGNNGGDGFVVANLLKAAGWPVRLAELGSKDSLHGEAAEHAAPWTGAIESLTPQILDGAGLIVDAIFGAGLSRAIDGPAKVMIEAMDASRIPICAIDVPSGLDGATGLVRGAAAKAELTVTFFRKKPGHLLFPGRALCGDVVLADIGIPESVLTAIGPNTFENGPDLWLHRYPWPGLDGYKFKRGHALVLGGAEITGASRMTARAALRAGAGLVTLAAPASVWPIYAVALTDVMTRRFMGLDDFVEILADERINALALGPGAGIGEDTRNTVLAALATKRATLLDADALTVFAAEPRDLFTAVDGPVVLTPHAGEFARLFDTSGDKLTRTRRAAAQSHAVVLLKGADTVIAAPDGRAIINANAPPQLATGGSGDVLAGIITGLLAQGLDPFDAAAIGAWLHGAAATEFGLGLVAEDLLGALPPVIQALKRRLDREPG
jgi:NAD(P)H-hydrate epimerase